MLKALKWPDDGDVSVIVEQRFQAHDTSAHAAFFDSGVGNAVHYHVVRVDPAVSCFELRGHTFASGEVAGPHAVGQAVVGVVGQADAIAFIVKRPEIGDRPKNFLAGGDIIQ